MFSVVFAPLIQFIAREHFGECIRLTKCQTLSDIYIRPFNSERAGDELINLPIQHSKYHGCRCPGSLRRQNINTHNIDGVE